MPEGEIDVLRDIRDSTIPVYVYSQIMVPVDIQDLTGDGWKKARQLYCSTLTILSSAIRSASGQSGAFDVSGYREGVFFVDVTSIEAGSTLIVDIKTKDPIGGDWFSILPKGAMTFTAPGQSMDTRQYGMGGSIRAEYTISGTVTFSVSAIVKS